MKKVFLIAALLLIPLFTMSAIAEADPLQVGAAEVTITPPVGSIMGDSYGITIAEGVDDDLSAKVLVFEREGVKAAFIACDLIGLPHALVVRTRELIEKQTGIPGSNVIMAATHAHAGPQMNPLFWDAVGGEPKQKSKEYFQRLPKMIVEGVESAEADLQPTRVSVGTVEQTSINFNRRFLMRDGTVKMNPGRMNPDKVRPVGPVDPDVSVVYFESLDSKPLATLVNFALHVAVVGGNHISADFPGTLSNLLAEVKGEDMVTVFTNGTSGNINHVDVTQEDQLSGHEEAARIGTILAADVLKALPSLRAIEINSLQVRSKPVELPVPDVDLDEVAWAQEVMARYGQDNAPSFSDVVEAWRIIDLAGREDGLPPRHELTTTVPLVDGGGAIQSEVQVLALGDELALVGFPGDAFVELGLTIKENSPFPFTIVSEQSGNGVLSYVPNRKAFSEGGYEVVSARVAPGGGELLVDAVIHALIDLYPHSWTRERISNR